MAMEQETGQTRTEAPTPRRREDAREQGQVAFSGDLTTGLLLLAGLGVLVLAGSRMGLGLLEAMRRDLLHAGGFDVDAAQAQALFVGLLGRGLQIVGWLLAAIFVAAVAIPALQVGFHLSPGLLSPQLERIAPAKGWARLLSRGSMVRGLAALLKVAAAAGIAWWVIRGRGWQIANLNAVELDGMAGQAWSLALRLGLAVAGTMVVLGAADYVYQRWNLEQSLRMTRQELKEELKEEEGDPMVKARIRKLQREATKKRMFQDVPKATFVVTNPTHLAVALHYEAGVMSAPRVVAKGAGLIAERIVTLARRHGVPVLERKPLAQALFKAVPIGREIPAALYVVVAEVLAHVYRLRGLVKN